MKRLGYVDFLRGSAVIWMVILQSLHSFGFLDIYGVDYWWILNWVNWFPLFMTLVGFSLGLSFRRRKGFVRRNAKRGAFLIVVGGLLCILKGWVVFNEALSGIGLSILLLVPLVRLLGELDGPTTPILWFILGGLSWLATRSIFGFGSFNPFWLLSFMFVGVGLCGLFES